MESTVEGELHETGTVWIDRADLDRRSIKKVERNPAPVSRPVATFASHRKELKFIRAIRIGHEHMLIPVRGELNICNLAILAGKGGLSG